MSALTALAVFGMAELKGQTTWTGSVSTDWGTAGNWSAGLPSSIVDAVIPSGTTNSPVVSTASTWYTRNLTINAGATLTIGNSSTTTYNYFRVAGTLSNAGTLTVSGGSYYTYAYAQQNVVNTGTINVAAASTYTTGMYFGGSSIPSTYTVTNSGTISCPNTYSRIYFYGACTNQTGATITSYSYLYFYRDLTNAGTLSMTYTSSSYAYFYGSLTNSGSISFAGIGSNYFYGNITNNGTTFNVGNRTCYFNAVATTSYPDAVLNASISGTSATSLYYLYIQKYIGTTSFGKLTINCDVTTTYSSTQSTYLYGGTLEIGAATLTTYAFYTGTSATYQPTLEMTNANARLYCTYRFYPYTACLENITAGTIDVGTYAYIYSNSFTPTGGTLRFVGTTGYLYMTSSYTSARLFNVQIGNGSSCTCYIGTGPHNYSGSLTISTNATAVANTASMLINVAGNWVNNGTFTANTSTVTFNGTSTISGTSTTTFNHLAVATASTLTASTGTVNVNGNFTRTGTFNHNNGTVAFTGTTASTISGGPTFYNLSCTAAGKTLTFTSSTTTTVAGVLTLNGISGSPVYVRASSTGVQATINDAGTESIGYVDVQDSAASSQINASANGWDNGNNTNWLFPMRVTAAATAGSAIQRYAHETGNGDGIQAGVFTLSANSAGSPTVTSITLQASGTADDSTAYSEVALYRDTGGTTAQYDAGVDTIYGTAVTAYSADNGTATFTANLTIPTSTSVTFFVVVKLNGSTLATPGQSLLHRVSALTVQSGLTAGTPTVYMAGITIQTPSFTFADQGGTAQTAYPSSGGHLLQEFTVSYAAGPANSLSSLTLGSDGTGDDSTDYDTVAIYHDSNTNGSFDSGTDTLVGSQTAFATDNGSVTITLSGSAVNFSAGQTKTFFVVGTYNSNPAQGETFTTAVTAAAYGYTGTTSSTLPAPAAGYSPGVTIDIPGFTVADTSPGAQTNAYMNGSGFMLQRFTIAYPSGPTNAVTGITVNASGTGDDLNDYASVALFRDANSNSTYDSGTDVQVDTTTAFSADNGTVTFALSGSESVFAAGTTREYFVIVGFNTNGSNGDTFQSQVTGVSGTQFGASVAGTPAPATAAPGLLLQDNQLVVTLNGPGSVTSVNSNSTGSFGNGELLCDVTLTAGVAAAWGVNTLTFEADGTGGHATDFSQLALYEDNGNAVFDAADTLAASTAAAFAAGTLDVTFTLTSPSLPGGTARRFFLAGILNGLAVSGETFNASLSATGTTPPTGGTVSGVPTAASTALIIDTTVLSVGPGPANPAAFMHKAGTALDHVLGQLRLSATNNDIDVTAITFATAGSGNWIAETDSANGFQVWLDDGDGAFSALSDTQLFASGGAGSINAVFASTVTVPNAGFRDLWIRTSLLSSAAIGSTSPLSWNASVASTTDVSTVGGVLVSFGITSPQTATLSAVDFFVTTFTPIADLPAGGKPITISGSGFMSPLVVRINGVICPGTPTVTPTQISGLLVPAGTGSNRSIEITSGALAPQVISQTFTYENVTIIGPGTGGGGGGGGGGGCAATTGSPAALLLALLAALSVAAVRSNRRNRTTA